MKTYKYFFLSDNNKEAIGKVKALNRLQALKTAAKRKNLNLEHFVEVWDVEIVNG